MKFKLFLILTLVCAGCATHRPVDEMNSTSTVLPDSSAARFESDPPKLKLTAYPRVGLAPMNVTVTASLENVSSRDKEFHCLWEGWNFGDGAVSGQKEYCGQLTSEWTVETDYLAEHVYRTPGRYVIYFNLGEGKVTSNRVTITVLER